MEQFIIFLPFIFVLSVGFVLFPYFLTKKKKPTVMVVKGIIGPGKSTLLSILENNERIKQKYNKIVLVREPLALWQELGALKEFYQDVKSKSYEFQTLVFATRILAVREAYEKCQNASLYIVERDCDCDEFAFVKTLYEDKCISESQMAKYKIWGKCWRNLMPFEPSHVLFIDPGVEICMERLKKRDRDGESGVTEEYQRHLYDNYSKMIDQCQVKNMRLTLQTDYRQPGKEQDELVDIVLNFLK
jgi:deoxyadenosine/deoxycytidine kinase